MKKLSFVIAILALAAVTAPAAGQQLSASYEFNKAVRDRNGPKAIDLLASNPPGLINMRDGEGNTPLIVALTRKDSAWTGFLLGKNADVNLPGKGGDTPLIAAARAGFREAVEWLLAKGAKVDATNKMGETALIVAVQRREPQMVRALLSAGADPDKTDSAAGYSARDYAARDNRSRQLLQLIEAARPKVGASATR